MENPEGSTPSPAVERTEEFTPPAPQPDSDRTTTLPITEPTQALPKPTQAEADKRLAAELARRGVPPDEIQRLVALGREAAPTPSAKTPIPSMIIPTELVKEEPFVPKPEITLPEFRDSSEKERADADRLLTAANLARRRGNFKEAENSVRAALELTPKDAAALELYGDILQSVGRVDDAAFAYSRALEADPSRKTAEKKYAELALLQNRAVHLLREEYIPRSPFVAVLFSAVFPGAGQLYNGDTVKGLITAILTLILVVGIFWSPWGIPSQKTEQIPTSIFVLILLFSAVYLFAVIDANISAKRGRKLKSGWEV
jgi:TM2 domain-containing membrane protein YozV